MKMNIIITLNVKQFSCRNVVKFFFSDAPKVLEMHDRQAFVGSVFIYFCPYIVGNPSDTKITWRRESDNRTWHSDELRIENVSQSFDHTTFTCEAENFIATTGQPTRTGHSAKSFKLAVVSKYELYFDASHTPQPFMSKTLHKRFNIADKSIGLEIFALRIIRIHSLDNCNY